MIIENWITYPEESAPIPDPLPEEMQNREIRVSGYSGVANTQYSVGKIQALLKGEEKFTIENPLIWGARWAYSNGLWLILIVKKKYHVMQAGFTFTDPIYGGTNPDPYGTLSIGFYFHSYKYYEEVTIRKEFYYDAYEPLIWRAYETNGYPVPSPYSVGSLSITIPFKTYTSENLGAEVLINQLTSHTVYANERWMNSEWWIEGGHISAYSFDSWQIEVNDTLADMPNYNGIIFTPKLSQIEAKAKKWRVSPRNSNFLEYAIDIINRPCDVRITVDPALKGGKDDHFCLEYPDYNLLMDRFKRIEEKLNELPP